MPPGGRMSSDDCEDDWFNANFNWSEFNLDVFVNITKNKHLVEQIQKIRKIGSSRLVLHLIESYYASIFLRLNQMQIIHFLC